MFIHFYKCTHKMLLFTFSPIFNLKIQFEFLYAFLKTILYENYFYNYDCGILVKR